VKRALAPTILAIEAEAIAPYVQALREADRVLESLAARNAASTWDTPSRVDFVKRAEAAHELLRPLLARHVQDVDASARKSDNGGRD
jgi:hypothetical protein